MAQRGVLAFSNPDELQDLIDAYFDSRQRTRYVPTGKVDGELVYEAETYMAPPTVMGLALALGVSRQTLLAYSKGQGTRGDGFAPVIARARDRVAEWWEEALATREASTGAQFVLRVNHGWGDDDDGGAGDEGFQMVTIPPAKDETIKAIPKWSDDDAQE